MYDEAINIDPKYAAAYRSKGKSLKKQKKYQSALKFYNEAIKIDPKYATAYSNKAKVLVIFGKYQEAMEIYDEAIKINPKNAAFYFNKGWINNINSLIIIKFRGIPISCRDI